MAKGKKTGGREAGTPNKLTKELRTALKDLVYAELESLPDKLHKLDTDKRLEILIKLLPYAIPKVEPVKFNNGEPFNIWDN